MRNSRLLTGSCNLITAALLLFWGPAFGAEPDMRLVDIGHAQLNVQVWEPSSDSLGTIIALPGSGGDVTRYKYLAPLLADAGFSVVAVNQRGIMGSTGDLDGLTLHDYAADVAALIDRLDVPQAHLLGWALGNRIARAVATDFPDKVASVSLIAAGGLASPLTLPGELARLLGEANIPEAEKLELARRTLFSDQTIDEIVLDYVRGLNYWPLEEWWAGGNGPMLIVQGVDDKTAPPENGHRMKDEFGDRITVIDLEAAGHAMGLEKPEETANAILDFLAKHPITAVN